MMEENRQLDKAESTCTTALTEEAMGGLTSHFWEAKAGLVAQIDPLIKQTKAIAKH